MTSLDEIRKRDAAHWSWHDAPQQTVTGSVAIHDRRELLTMIDSLIMAAHSEDHHRRCRFCGVRWPCGEWVDARERQDAQP